MKRTAKVTYIILAIIAFLATLLILFNNYAENRIKVMLEDNLKKASITWEKLDVNILGRKASITDPRMETDSRIIGVNRILISDIHLWDYFVKNEIIIGRMEISGPEVKLYNGDKPGDTVTTKNHTDLENKILIQSLQVSDGSLAMLGMDDEDKKFYAAINILNLKEVKLDAETLKDRIPFNYESLSLEMDSLSYHLSEQYRLAAERLLIDKDRNLSIEKFRMIPQYSKSEFQETIEVEKDWYDLSIDSIEVIDLNWSFAQDSLQLKSELTRIDAADLRIYRNRLKPDDTSFKPMYSQMIRQLPIKLGLDSISLTNTYIKYEENIHPDPEAGVVEFSDLNAGISNLTNIGMSGKDFPKTRIKVNADFMRSAPLEVLWEFDVSNRNDEFHISGELGRLAAEEINSFLTPARNVKASGEILNMYFNFYGNDTRASGDMRVEYKDFSVEVLQKGGEEKNSILSFFTNLVVGDKALNEKANYKDVSFTRDKTKSFWNYFWNLIRNGAMKAFL